MDKPTVGRIVHYVLSADDINKPQNEGQHRAAIVTNGPFGEGGAANLKVFLDGTNDGPGRDSTGMLWATTVNYSETHEPGTWHWPERA